MRSCSFRINMDCSTETSFIDVDALDHESDEEAQLIIDDDLTFCLPEACEIDLKDGESLHQEITDSYPDTVETKFYSETLEEFQEDIKSEHLLIMKEETDMDIKVKHNAF